MKPSHPSSRSLGAGRYSAGYLKRNLKTNPATKHLITICPVCRRGAYFFRAMERTTGNNFVVLFIFDLAKVISRHSAQQIYLFWIKNMKMGRSLGHVPC